MSSLMLELLFLVFLIALNAFFAAAEIGIISVSKLRLRQMIDDDVPQARLVHSLAENSSRLLATVQVGVTFVGFFSAASAAVTLSGTVAAALRSTGVSFIVEQAQAIAVAGVTIILALLVLIFGELVPKNLAVQHSEQVAFLVARPLAAVAGLLAPIVSVLSGASDAIVRLLGGQAGARMPFVTEDEIKTMVDAGEEVGVLEEREKNMIYGVFEIAETTVREVMVPRIDVAGVEVNTPPRQAAAIAVHSGHSRLPVYEETLDTVLGILHVQDLLSNLISDAPSDSLRPLVQPVHFVPELKRVDDLLRDMQSLAIQMAIVVDEYGGTDGLVTIEDLLEEIVGEIKDEHDREEAQTERLPDGSVVFNGRVRLDDVNDMLDLDLAGGEVDTIGGFVSAQLGKVAVRGDRLELPEATFEVVASAGRRAKKIRVKVKAPEVNSPDNG